MKKLIFLFLLFIGLVCGASYTKANEVDLVFFWGDGCPHCERPKPFLKALEEEFPELKVHMFETWRNPENAKKFRQIAKAYNSQARGVPAFFIGDYEPIFGYNTAMNNTISDRVRTCIRDACTSPFDKIRVSGDKTSKTTVKKSPRTDKHHTVVYYFWGDGCPHCDLAKNFLDELKVEFPSLELRSLEAWRDSSNAKKFRQMAKAYNSQARGVPAIFIAEHDPIFGFSSHMAPRIREKVKNCIDKGCRNPAVVAGIEQELCIHLFYRPSCPQCINAKEYLLGLENTLGVSIHAHNVSEDEARNLFDIFKDKYGLTQVSYPIVFVGGKYFIGERSIVNNLEDTVNRCKLQDCPCPAEKVLGMTPIIPRPSEVTADESAMVRLPIFGEINLVDSPLVLTTFLIAFVDGFNPCSMWLIMFLLGMLMHTRSRKKMLIVALTFLLITASAYGVFMLGVLNVFMYVGYMTWIQILVAMAALLFAAVNIKDYFWFKKGISFTISDEKKPGIFKRMREIIRPDRSIPSMIAATAVLALGVVLVELPCTAGFPVVWANLLAQNEVSGMYFVALFSIYILVYLLIELIIILAAVISLKATRFEEKHGRILKLVGGLVMASLAGFMLLAPDTLNTFQGTLWVFLIAALSSGLVIIVHRKLLPSFGIKIGSEED